MDTKRDQIEQQVRYRDELRRAGDFVRADKIRDNLAAVGVIVEDYAGGSLWRVGKVK